MHGLGQTLIPPSMVLLNTRLDVSHAVSKLGTCIQLCMLLAVLEGVHSNDMVHTHLQHRGRLKIYPLICSVRSLNLSCFGWTKRQKEKGVGGGNPYKTMRNVFLPIATCTSSRQGLTWTMSRTLLTWKVGVGGIFWGWVVLGGGGGDGTGRQKGGYCFFDLLARQPEQGQQQCLDSEPKSKGGSNQDMKTLPTCGSLWLNKAERVLIPIIL